MLAKENSLPESYRNVHYEKRNSVVQSPTISENRMLCVHPPRNTIIKLANKSIHNKKKVVRYNVSVNLYVIESSWFGLICKTGESKTGNSSGEWTSIVAETL